MQSSKAFRGFAPGHYLAFPFTFSLFYLYNIYIECQMLLTMLIELGILLPICQLYIKYFAFLTQIRKTYVIFVIPAKSKVICDSESIYM